MQKRRRNWRSGFGRERLLALRGDTPKSVKGRGRAADLVSSQPSARRCALFVQAGAPPIRQPLTVLSPHSGLFVRSGQKHELSALRPFQQGGDKTQFGLFMPAPHVLLFRALNPVGSSSAAGNFTAIDIAPTRPTMLAPDQG